MTETTGTESLAAAERLLAWSEDWSPGRFHLPTYANPGELKADCKAVIAERDRYRAALHSVIDPASSWNLADDRPTALMRLAYFVNGVLDDA